MSALKRALQLSALALGPAAVFGIAGHFIYSTRPWINLDYFVAGVAALFLPVWAGAALFALVITDDILLTFAPIYHFQLPDLFRGLQDAMRLGTGFLLQKILLLIVLGAGGGYLLSRWGCPRARGRRQVIAAWMAIALATVAFDIVNGTNFLNFRPVPFYDINLVYSGARRSWQAMKQFGNESTVLQALHAAPENGRSSAMDQTSARIREGTDNLVLVLVESMGRFKERQARRLLRHALLTPEVLKKYDLDERGPVPFEGNTIHGEFRELCQAALVSYGAKNLPKCLPSEFKEAGFETLSLHGFTSQFYDRSHWYPIIGFDRSIFAEDMRGQGVLPRCGGAFPGVCDSDMASVLHQELLKNDGKKKFIYWMTLTSHLPVDSAQAQKASIDCSKSEATAAHPEICDHTRILSNTLSMLSKIATDPAIPPTTFVVVGDHAPPFANPELRELYAPDRVSHFVLKPKARGELKKAASAAPNPEAGVLARNPRGSAEHRPSSPERLAS